MQRDIPASARQAAEREGSPDVLLAFLTVTHQNLSEPIRIVSDVFDYVLEGETYKGIVFDAKPLTDTDAAPVTELRVQNVDRRIGEALERAEGRAQAALRVISSSDFDLTQDPRVALGTPEDIYSFRHFDLVDVDVNPIEITGRLMLRDYSQEPWPGIAATEERLPGLFR